MSLRSHAKRLLHLLRLPAANWKGLWLPAAILFFYLYSFPYFAGIQSANELPRIYLAMAIVDRGALNIDPELQRFQPTPDTSTYKGKLYCNKAPGMSFLAVPAYAAMKRWFNSNMPLGYGADKHRKDDLRNMFYWLRLSGATLPSLLFLLLVWRFLGALIPRVATRRWVLAAYALGTMASTYGTLLIAHQLSGLLVATGYMLLFLRGRGRGGWWTPALAGLASGAGVLVDYQVAFIGPPLFIYGLVVLRHRFRGMTLFAAGAAIPLAALLLYQWGAFDSPLRTGYHFPTNLQFQQWHSQGFLGMKGFSADACWAAFFSADNGLFYFSPFLLLALPGVVVMFCRRGLRADAVFCLLLMLMFAYFTSSLSFWPSGWDVGPRYITCALPYFLVPVAVLLARLGEARWYWGIVPRGLMAASILFYVTINAVFPHFPGNFSNPWLDLIVRFGRAGFAPYNLGWLLGLRGLPTLLPVLAVLAALLLALMLTGQRRVWQRVVTAAGVLVLITALLTFHHSQLSRRLMPVPNDQFLGWMAGMWEPKHEKLDTHKLLPVGDRKKGGLKTRVPWYGHRQKKQK